MSFAMPLEKEEGSASLVQLPDGCQFVVRKMNSHLTGALWSVERLQALHGFDFVCREEEQSLDGCVFVCALRHREDEQPRGRHGGCDFVCSLRITEANYRTEFQTCVVKMSCYFCTYTSMSLDRQVGTCGRFRSVSERAMERASE